MQIQVSKLTDTDLLRKACGFTIDKESKMSLASIYQCEHSPARTQMFCVEMRDIPTFVSVHLVRHKVGVEHFVKSNREDRLGYTGDLGRHQPVNHMMLINAQALIQMARKRLCTQAHVGTQEVMAAIKGEVAKVDPDLARHMVTECEYRNGYCPERKPCGRNQAATTESPFTFPPAHKFITGAYTGQSYLDKLREETDELATEVNRLNHTQDGNLHNLLMEAWDIVHVAETYIRRVCKTHGIDPAVAHKAVVEKNRSRQYYDEVK